MQPSIAGILVCAALLAIGYVLRAPVIVPLFASFAFGTTAIVNLPALGGASPLVYTAFAILTLVSVLGTKASMRDLGTVFALHRTSFLVLAFLAYVCLSAFVFPRLFQGETNVFVARVGGSQGGGVLEVPLAPTNSNVTQTAYFSLGALMYFAIVILLSRRGQFDVIRRGFIAWAVAHALLGVINFAGNLVRLGDVLLPIRTANYALLTEVEQAGFYRVVGGFPEASSFASMTIGGLGFAFAYWKVTKSLGMLLVTITLLLLLLLSTSSTAYGTLGIAALPLSVTMLHSLLIGRLSRANAYVLAMGALVIAAGLCLYLYDSRIFDPFVRLFESTVLNKQNTSSGKERAYWNTVSLQALADTGLLGVGMGSSRTSSWAIAVLCQLGVPGAIFVLLMIWQLARGSRTVRTGADLQMVALYNGARASALCLLTAAAVSAGTADPGIQVFISLGVVVACRRRLNLVPEGAQVQLAPGGGIEGSWRMNRPSPPVRCGRHWLRAPCGRESALWLGR